VSGEPASAQRFGSGSWSQSSGDALEVVPTWTMPLSPLFWMTNVLNVLDALLTAVLIELGLAGEANPVVASIGWHGKFALVLAASLVLDRLRPRALILPCFALSVVVCYSAAGLFFLI
jgi:hypothetical protein